MRIKTFEAPTMQEALTLARNELGDEAVVLNTKHVKSGGVLGLGGASRVQLMAAVDAAMPEPPTPATQGVAAPAVAVAAPVAAPVMAEVPAAAPFVTRVYTGAAPVQAEPEPDIKQIRAEISQLTSIVQSLLRSDSAQALAVAPAGSLLSRLGVDEAIAQKYLPDLAVVDDPVSLTAALAARMQSFATPPDLSEKRVIAVVGPTGVGKTTTLAKLAAKFSLEQNKSVAMVTADTFRIGAVEQLRTYARIMGVPLETALSPDDVAAGVEKHRDKDVVLIDTVGRSQRSTEHLAELRAFLAAAGQVEVHLVTAASLAADVQAEVMEQFAIFSPSRLIITKLDESPSRGCLVNLPLSTGLGISCTTAGQNVPQDIDFADAGRLARFVTEVA